MVPLSELPSSSSSSSKAGNGGGGGPGGGGGGQDVRRSHPSILMPPPQHSHHFHNHHQLQQHQHQPLQEHHIRDPFNPHPSDPLMPLGFAMDPTQNSYGSMDSVRMFGNESTGLANVMPLPLSMPMMGLGMLDSPISLPPSGGSLESVFGSLGDTSLMTSPIENAFIPGGLGSRVEPLIQPCRGGELETMLESPYYTADPMPMSFGVAPLTPQSEVSFGMLALGPPYGVGVVPRSNTMSMNSLSVMMEPMLEDDGDVRLDGGFGLVMPNVMIQPLDRNASGPRSSMDSYLADCDQVRHLDLQSPASSMTPNVHLRSNIENRPQQLQPAQQQQQQQSRPSPLNMPSTAPSVSQTEPICPSQTPNWSTETVFVPPKPRLRKAPQSSTPKRTKSQSTTESTSKSSASPQQPAAASDETNLPCPESEPGQPTCSPTISAPNPLHRTRPEVLNMPLNIPANSIKESCACKVCKTELALLILHGDEEKIKSSRHLADVTCMTCFHRQHNVDGMESLQLGLGGSSSSKERPSRGGVKQMLGIASTGSPTIPSITSSQSSPKAAIPPALVDASIPLLHTRGRKKKRGHQPGADRAFRCEACGHSLGFGGVRVLEEGEGEGVKGGGWVDVDFGVEVICAECVTDFGGGTYRTGKWRSRQLFQPPRRTCNLSHARIGDKPHVQIVTYNCPIQPLTASSAWDPEILVSGDILSRVPHAKSSNGAEILTKLAEDVDVLGKEVFQSWINVPNVMRVVPGLWTWEMTEQRRVSAQNEIQIMVKGGWHPARPEPTGEEVKRFFAGAYIPKPSSRRHRKATGSLERDIEVLMKDDGRYLGADEVERIVQEKGKDKEQELVMIGFSCVQWFVTRRHIQLAHCHLMGKDGKGMQSLHDKLHQSIFHRIEILLQTASLPPPLHIWAQVRRALNGTCSTQVGNWPRLGMVPLEQYLALYHPNGFDPGPVVTEIPKPTWRTFRSAPLADGSSSEEEDDGVVEQRQRGTIPKPGSVLNARMLFDPMFSPLDWFVHHFDLHVMRFSDRPWGGGRKEAVAVPGSGWGVDR
ncbi:hypothetical protein HDU97_001582 [Phlyctochytrium planicorne]|nr:hypothetical protein HDU97_001582 [Phlyctochytrium planicorne]